MSEASRTRQEQQVDINNDEQRRTNFNTAQDATEMRNRPWDIGAACEDPEGCVV